MAKHYKICILDDNKISEIYVFNGKDDYDDKDIRELYKSDITIFDGIFNRNELDHIEENKIPIYFSNMILYEDDSIETIKKKILKRKSDLTFDGMYLFCSYKETLDTQSIYLNLTQNGTQDLTKLRLIEFLTNIREFEKINDIIDKDILTYEDLQDLKLEKKKYSIDKALGQKFIALNKSYIYTINPYNVLLYDQFLDNYASELINTTNKTLLFQNNNYENIDNDTIYLCDVENVLEYVERKGLSVLTTLKIYYNYLYRDGITSLKLFKDEKNKLIEKSK